MNCQKGDIARIISNVGTRNAKLADRIIRVIDPVGGMNGEPFWTYEGAAIRCGCGCGGEIESFADRLLRPIRDPGPDAVDETLAWLPVPTTDEVPA